MYSGRILVSIALLAASSAIAQSYPAKPVRIIIPFTSGAAADTVARLIAPKLTDAMGQPIVIENRPGAGGVLAADLVAKSAPDGYTLMMGSPGPLTINPVLLSKVPYDPARDFAPITLVAIVPSILLVNPSLPAKTVKELIALAKAKAGQLNFASAGNGSVPHLTGELFKLSAGIEAVHVPYKGSAPAITDMLGGRVSFFFDNIASGMPYVKSEKLRGLAVTSTSRSKLVPELPTMIEAGVPGFEAASWSALVAPAGTPEAIVTRLHAEVVKAVRQPEIGDRLRGLGTEVVANTPGEFNAFMTAERAKWAKVIKSARITVE